MTAQAQAAIYARVSTDEQAEHGTSLEAQLEECDAHARRLGATGVTAFVDAGISGTLLERPALTRLRLAAAAGQAALVVCYDPDRLSRNLGHLLLLVDEFRRAGARVEFTNFALTQSPDGRLLFAMRGAIAEFETHKIRQRMTAGKLARAREGRPVGGGHRIYGYTYDKAAKRFVPDPVEAPVVREIFRLAEEHGTYEVAARLTAAGVPTKQGGPWSQTTIYGILRNRTYLGKMPQMGGAGHVELVPLITDDAFERAAAAVGRRRNRPIGPARHPYLLSGRIRCGLCGRRMGGGYGRPTAAAYVTRYACSGKRSLPPCPSAYYRSDVVDHAVWQEVLAFLALGPERAAVAARLHQATLAAAPAAPSDGQQAAALGRQRQRLLHAYRSGLFDAAALRDQLGALNAARALADRQEASAAALRVGLADADALLMRTLTAIGRATALADRRLVLEALGANLVLGPGNVGVLAVRGPKT